MEKSLSSQGRETDQQTPEMGSQEPQIWESQKQAGLPTLEVEMHYYFRFIFLIWIEHPCSIELGDLHLIDHPLFIDSHANIEDHHILF